jgi:hypothetical protein
VKCGSAAALEFERSIYQEVLASLPLPSLRCYGFLEAGSTAWLFLEDAEQGSIFHRPIGNRRRWPNGWVSYTFRLQAYQRVLACPIGARVTTWSTFKNPGR